MTVKETIPFVERMKLLTDFTEMHMSSKTVVRIMTRVGDMPDTQIEQEANRIHTAIQGCKTNREVVAVLDEMGIE